MRRTNDVSRGTASGCVGTFYLATRADLLAWIGGEGTNGTDRAPEAGRAGGAGGIGLRRGKGMLLPH